jgi:hypothetical protein
MLSRRNFLILAILPIAFGYFNFTRKKSDLCKFKKDIDSSNLFFDGWILKKEDIELLCD